MIDNVITRLQNNKGSRMIYNVITRLQNNKGKVVKEI
jgi:hypothetical protein